MEDELFLDKLDLEKGTVKIRGKDYALLDSSFPTVDPKDPYALTPEEAEVMERLQSAFLKCENSSAMYVFCIQTAVCTKYTMEIFSITAVYL